MAREDGSQYPSPARCGRRVDAVRRSVPVRAPAQGQAGRRKVDLNGPTRVFHVQIKSLLSISNELTLTSSFILAAAP